MAVRNRQIGWSPMSNALYDVLREFNALKGQLPGPFASTTTTSTTIPFPPATVSVDITGYEQLFDIPYVSSYGWFMKVTNDIGLPRIFSFGQFPSAYQAASIEGGVFKFYYNGNVEITYPLTNYIGQWVWMVLGTTTSGTISLSIDGQTVANSNSVQPITLPTTLYIGSENTPNTNYNGLMKSFIVELGLTTPQFVAIPTTPFQNSGNSLLILFQGLDITQQTTDQGQLILPVTNSGAVYNTDSPYLGYGGSTQFGAI